MFKPSAFIRQSRSLWNHKAEPCYLKPPCSCSKNSGGKSSFSAMIHLGLCRGHWCLAQGQSTSVSHWCHTGVTPVGVGGLQHSDTTSHHAAAVPGAVWLQRVLGFGQTELPQWDTPGKGPIITHRELGSKSSRAAKLSDTIYHRTPQGPLR